MWRRTPSSESSCENKTSYICMYGHHHHHHACVPFQYIRGITKYRERTAVVGTPRSPRLLSACFFFAFPFFVSLFVASSFFFLFRTAVLSNNYWCDEGHMYTINSPLGYYWWNFNVPPLPNVSLLTLSSPPPERIGYYTVYTRVDAWHERARAVPISGDPEVFFRFLTSTWMSKFTFY